ncbi:MULTISPECIES: hypothetical protein [Lactobacillaceae]|uniref:hypothetical protein n=1 Tax=Lactobacillaceae TaxID=33958 RepID=UPI0014577078|nr:hypothetical protein [Lactobacillus sp. HBUAS51381]NLR08943.1 hypothetical protein [Lactobacillus sp. HBUAS51381]
MRAKNIGALIGVVLISGAVLVVSGHNPNSSSVAAARVTARATRLAPPENKRHSVEPVGQLERTPTKAEREPIVPSRDAGTTAPTGTTDDGS